MTFPDEHDLDPPPADGPPGLPGAIGKRGPLDPAATELRESRICFMVGAGRSGTTWLWRCLACHPEILGVPETHFFDFEHVHEKSHLKAARASFWKLVNDLVTKTSGERSGSASEHPFRHIRRGYVEDFFESIGADRAQELHQLFLNLREFERWDDVARTVFASFDGVLPWIVEKTPRHALKLERIKALYPAAKIIGIVRDGRDVLASLRAFGRPWSERISEVREASAHWTRCNRGILDAAARWPEDVLIVRYEDFLADFDRALARMLYFLGVNADPRLLAETREANTFKAYTGREAGDGRPGEFNRQGTAGGFREEVPHEDVAEYERLTGELLRAFGYVTASRVA